MALPPGHLVITGSGGRGEEWDYDRMEDNYDTFYKEKRKKRNPGKRPDNIRLLVIFCKSFCFVILMVSFIFVLVIVSVFMAKGFHNHV